MPCCDPADDLSRSGPDGEELAAILRDVRELVACGSFPVAARRFGELRLEDGRHQALEHAALDPLEPRLSPRDRAALARLGASRARLLGLEATCAAALERGLRDEYRAAAAELEGELTAHAALERWLTRRLHVFAKREGGDDQ